MPGNLTWQPLVNGDKVAFLPSSVEVRNAKPAFAEWLKEQGLELYKSKDDDFENYFGNCGTPQQRAEAIVDALQNEEVKAIFLRGGDGADEVIECLKKYDLPKRGIPLIGYSDATQIQNYLSSIGVCSAAQGVDPDKYTTPLEGQPPEVIKAAQKIREAMSKFLLEGVAQNFSLTPLNASAKIPGEISGQMVVFNEHSRRSEYRTLTDSSISPILLLEGGMGDGKKFEIGIPFAIEYLKQQGQLENLRAIVLSQTDANPSKDCSREQQLEKIQKIISDQGVNVPVFIGAPFGHGPLFSSLPIPLHTNTRISVAENAAMLCTEAAPTKENAEQIQKLCAEREKYVPLTAAEPVRINTEIPEKLAAITCVRNPRHIDFTKSRENLLCAVNYHHRGCEVSALDGVDLAGKNVAIFFGMPSLETWKKQQPEENYFFVAKGAMQLSLMELLKSGELRRAHAVTFCTNEPLPKKMETWLQDFAERHNLACAFSIAQVTSDFASKISPKQIRICDVEAQTVRDLASPSVNSVLGSLAENPLAQSKVGGISK